MDIATTGLGIDSNQEVSATRTWARRRRCEVRLVKLDYGAEVRPLEQYAPFGRYYDVHCPFCGTDNAIYYRNFCAGARCHNQNCRAMLRLPTHDATRDMLPKEETILRDGLITRPAAASKGWDEWKRAGCAETLADINTL